MRPLTSPERPRPEPPGAVARGPASRPLAREGSVAVDEESAPSERRPRPAARPPPVGRRPACQKLERSCGRGRRVGPGSGSRRLATSVISRGTSSHRRRGREPQCRGAAPRAPSPRRRRVGNRLRACIPLTQRAGQRPAASRPGKAGQAEACRVLEDLVRVRRLSASEGLCLRRRCASTRCTNWGARHRSAACRLRGPAGCHLLLRGNNQWPHRPTDLDIATELRQISSLAEVGKDALTELAAAASQRRVHAGQSVVDQGVPSQSLIILVRGAAKLVRTMGDGGESVVVLDVMRAPCIVADSSVIDGSARVRQRHHLRSSARVLAVDRRSVLRLLSVHPSIARALLTRFALEVRSGVRRIDEIVAGRSTERVTNLLSTFPCSRARNRRSGKGAFIADPARPARPSRRTLRCRRDDHGDGRAACSRSSSAKGWRTRSTRGLAL